MQNIKDRLEYIDCLKGIAIFMVIFQHCIGNSGAGVEYPISKFILAFHMPLFFFVSGYLYSWHNLETFAVRKFERLIVPTILFQLFNVFIYYALLLVGVVSKYSVFCFAGFWFLLSLLYVEFLYYLCDCVIKRVGERHALMYNMLFLIVALVLGSQYSKYAFGHENTMATSLVGAMFFIAGRIIKNIKEENIVFKKLNMRWLVGLLSLFAVWVLKDYNEPILMYISEYGNYYLFIITAFLGCIGMLNVSMCIPPLRILEYLGRNSLIIMVTQFPLYKIYMKAFSYTTISPVVSAFVATVVICVMEYGIITIVKSRFPILIGDFTKFVIHENNE